MTENEKRSRKEEAEYWKTHTIDEVEGEEVEVVVKKPLSSVFSIRLDPDDVKNLREMARAKGVGPSTMARMLLLEALKKPDGSGKPMTWAHVGDAGTLKLTLGQGGDEPNLVLLSKEGMDNLCQMFNSVVNQCIPISSEQVTGELSWSTIPPNLTAR